MAPVSSISSASAAPQSGLRQLRLQQAKRDAEQAEQIARSLQAEAKAAQQRASEAVDHAQATAAEANRAEVNAGQARRGLAAATSSVQMQARLTTVVTKVAEKLKDAEPAAEKNSVSAQRSAPPVINAAGQLTGTVVNVTA